MSERIAQRQQVALPRQEHVLAMSMPAGDAQQLRTQQIHPCPGPCRNVKAHPTIGLDAPRFLTAQVDLVRDDDALHVRRQPRIDVRRRRPIDVRIDQPQDHVRPADLAPCALDADLLHRVGRVTQARSIDDVQRNAFDLDRLAQGVPRRAGDLGDDRPLLAGKLVQQAGLAHIRLAHQHHVEAAAQQGALPRAVEHAFELRAQFRQPRQRACLLQEFDLFLGKIQRRLDQHAQVDQAVANAVDLLGKTARQRSHRRARRSGGRGLDQVGHAFGLREVQLAVQEGTAGEFTRLRQSRAELQAALQQQLHDHRAAMPLQLDDILAGEGSRPGEEKTKALVDRLARFIEEAGKAGDAGLRFASGQRAGEIPQAAAGHAHDTDASPARRRRDGSNRVRLPCRPCFHFRSSA